MKYSVVNLGPSLGQSEPVRYSPAGPSDCVNIAEYRRAMENAAERLAYYNQLMQGAVQAGNGSAVDRAYAGSELANRDWQAWAKVVKDCEQPSMPLSPEGSGVSGPSATLLTIGALVLGVALVGITVGIPKLKL